MSGTVQGQVPQGTGQGGASAPTATREGRCEGCTGEGCSRVADMIDRLAAPGTVLAAE